MWKRILRWTSDVLWKLGHFSPRLRDIGFLMMLRALETDDDDERVQTPLATPPATVLHQVDGTVFIDHEAIAELGGCEVDVNYGQTYLDVN